MAVEATLPALTTVIVSAAIDSINPCAIGVLILMASVLLTQAASMPRLLGLGFLYILSVFVTYLLAGMGLLYGLASIPLYMAEYISIFVGTLIVFAGFLEIKDFFWYGRWFSLAIPVTFSKLLDTYAQRATIPGIIFLGAFVSAVELPCTGAPYLAIITLLSLYFDWTAFLLLVLYNVIFVLPLIILLFMIAAGKKLHELKRWKQEVRPYMRLFIGLLLIALGWLLMLIANGTINLG
ncbi:GAP family protein [Candidatus Woesearchaeota archaeon]|nr:GAP family protein [Candidatus Woesearchaeota archaeon]